MLPGLSKTLDQFDIRFPASRSFISCLIGCEAVQICASRTFLLSEGHSAFPDQRMALFSSRFQCAENPLLRPSRAKGTHFAGILEDCWLLFADSKRPKTVWWTWSGSNRRPLPCHSTQQQWNQRHRGKSRGAERHVWSTFGKRECPELCPRLSRTDRCLSKAEVRSGTAGKTLTAVLTALDGLAPDSAPISWPGGVTLGRASLLRCLTQTASRFNPKRTPL